MTVRSKLENGILINYMAAQRWNIKVVALIGGNTRITTRKGMEHGMVLMETDTLGNS
jgi:hypothetical protein